MSVGQLFAPLLHGGRCVLVDAARRADSSALLTLTRAHGVTLWDVTPAMLHLLVDETDFPLCGTLRHVFCGGEAMDAELGRRFAARSQAWLHNLYGPTEAAIDTTWWSWPVDGGNAPPDVPPEAPPSAARSPTRRCGYWMRKTSRCRSVWKASCSSGAPAWPWLPETA